MIALIHRSQNTQFLPWSVVPGDPKQMLRCRPAFLAQLSNLIRCCRFTSPLWGMYSQINLYQGKVIDIHHPQQIYGMTTLDGRAPDMRVEVQTETYVHVSLITF